MASPVMAEEKTLVPQQTIISGLDAIEGPSIRGQVAALNEQKERVLAIALPMVEAKDTAGIAGLTWAAHVALQAPIYSAWSQGWELGGEHMKEAARRAIPRGDRGRFSGVPENIERYVLDPDVEDLLRQFLDLDPGTLVASAAQAAVLNRVVQLAGSFSQSQITALKGHLMAAILPQPGTGNPISRDDLLARIQSTLSVGVVRAKNIARTELTNAYNRGRVTMGLRSTLVEAFRFLAISDNRTTDICRSRNGMLLFASDGTLSANTPALHYLCRSTLSPVMPRVNPRHAQWMREPSRRAENRLLSDLLPGWT